MTLPGTTPPKCVYFFQIHTNHRVEGFRLYIKFYVNSPTYLII